MLKSTMYNLSDTVSIDVWERIALYVQFLEFSNKSDDEFEKNLLSLENALLENGIKFEIGKRYPIKDDQVGISSILESIYNSYSTCSNVKYNFFDQISMLKNLGVINIAFKEKDFFKDKKLVMYNHIQDDLFFINKDNVGYSRLNKSYTDATFNLERDILYYYMSNVCNLNYLLDIDLSFNNNQIDGDIVAFCANLTSFNGTYPDRDLLISRQYPVIDCYSYEECANKNVEVKQYLYKK